MATAGPLRSRPLDGERDLAAMYDLAAAYPAAALHLADLPWWLRALDPAAPSRGCLWEDEDGALLAWAALRSWNYLDTMARPGPQADRLADAILDWAEGHVRQVGQAAGVPLRLFTFARRHDGPGLARLQRRGFAHYSWRSQRLTRDLRAPLPEPVVPADFRLRPLDRERDIDAYVALHRIVFGGTRMTDAWRRATLADPHHVDDLDLVAVAADGTLAGFCVGWVTPPLPARGGAVLAQVQPLGAGAVQIAVDTDADNAPALRCYASVGFQPLSEEIFFEREVSPRLPGPSPCG